MFGLFESSRYRGSPINLYKFVYGPQDSDVLCYSDGEKTRIFAGNTYKPEAIDRDSINSSGTMDNTSLEIRLPASNPLVPMFIGYPPDYVVGLSIYQGHEDDADNDFKPLWRGRVLSFNLSGQQAKFSGQQSITSLQRPGLRRNYQFGCPHVLYGEHCKTVKLFVTSAIDEINGSNLIMPAGWNGAYAALKFQGGYVEWLVSGATIARRVVLKVVGDTITIAGPPINLFEGSVVKVILGCNHTTADCKDLHNNILNYGGQPWIPFTNPFGSTNNFY